MTDTPNTPLSTYKAQIAHKPDKDLRRGWTTGACATACAVAAVRAFLTKYPVRTVQVTLPTTDHTFPIVDCQFDDNGATAATVKDAGDDPDVTHGCRISVRIKPHANGTKFVAGDGVGTVTKAGLPLAVGEPAINPKPREMIIKNITIEAGHANWHITISVKDGEKLAQKTWNPRLGICGGISILGTTGIVIPFSCSAWIDSIRRGIDVAVCDNITHIIGATGTTSESVSQQLYNAPTQAMIDMGDFIGATIKYAKTTYGKTDKIRRITIAGGFAKMVKLAQGHLDVHSARSTVDFAVLADWIAAAGASDMDIQTVKTAPTALFVWQHVHSVDVAHIVAQHASQVLQNMLKNTRITSDICIVSRDAKVLYPPPHTSGDSTP